MIEKSDAGDVGRRLLDALTARVHLVDRRLRDRIAGLGKRTPRDVIDELVGDIVNVVALFGGSSAGRLLREIDAATGGTLALSPKDAVVPIEEEASVVEARRQAGLLAAKLGFRAIQRTKIITATSELARNIHMYAGAGKVEIKVVNRPCTGMLVQATDAGPGIPDLGDVMDGETRSKRGLGLGLRGVRAMADHFTIDSTPGRGTSVSAFFCFPSGAPAA